MPGKRAEGVNERRDVEKPARRKQQRSEQERKKRTRRKIFAEGVKISGQAVFDLRQSAAERLFQPTAVFHIVVN